MNHVLTKITLFPQIINRDAGFLTGYTVTLYNNNKKYIKKGYLYGLTVYVVVTY